MCFLLLILSYTRLAWFNGNDYGVLIMIESSLSGDITENVAIAAALAPLEEANGTHHDSDGKCRNCDTALIGVYCQNCGQKAAHLHKPIWELAEDMLHSVLHWDGRLWLTVRQLFLHPGAMTLDWVNGQQVRYMPPIRLFIFISLLLILVLSFSDVALVRINQNTRPVDQIPMNCIIDAWHKNVQLQDYDCDNEKSETKKAISIDIDSQEQSAIKFFTLIPKSLPKDDLVNESTIHTKNTDDKSRSFIKNAIGTLNEINKNPRVANELISHSISRFMIIAVPLMAIILKLFYARRKRYVAEHILFSLHVHTFFFLSLLICVLLTWVTRGRVGGIQLFEILWLAYSLHFLFAQSRFYGQGWIKTILKSIFITGFYMLGLIISASIAVALTVGKMNIQF